MRSNILLTLAADRDFGTAMSDRGYTRYHTNRERGWEGIARATAEEEKPIDVDELEEVVD